MPSESPKFNQYVDPHGSISSKDLQRAEWVAKNRTLIFGAMYGSLGFVAGILFLIGMIGWASFLFSGNSKDKQMFLNLSQSIQDYTALQKFYAPVDLRVSDITVTQSAPGRYDFGAIIENDNARKIAYITYHYEYSGGKTNEEKAVILPMSKRPIISFGLASTVFPSGAVLKIDYIDWETIDPHEVFDISSFKKERLDLQFYDFEFDQQDVAADKPSNSIKFLARNDATYSYWNLPIIVQLKRGSATVGYLQTTIPNFLSAQERKVDIRSVAPNLFATDIVVFPIDNVFNTNVFVPPASVLNLQ